MHEVQTSMRRTLPSIIALTRWMLGLNLRRVFALIRRRMAFFPSRLTLFPKLGCFPQSSQTEPISRPSNLGRGGHDSSRAAPPFETSLIDKVANHTLR
jgi:hypothetical protein